MMLLARSRLGPPQARITHTRSGDENHPGAQRTKQQWAGDPLSMGSRTHPRKAGTGREAAGVGTRPVPGLFARLLAGLLSLAHPVERPAEFNDTAAEPHDAPARV